MVYMPLEDRLRDILFQIGKEIKIHTIGKDMIIEIDYEKYVAELMACYDSINKDNKND
jgi:hypothetical protein